MFGLALRRAAKVESGYVCLPCLFKRLDLPTRHLVRYQTTTPQGIAVASKGELVVENDPKKKSSKEKSSPKTTKASDTIKIKTARRRRGRQKKAAKKVSASKDNGPVSIKVTESKGAVRPKAARKVSSLNIRKVGGDAKPLQQPSQKVINLAQGVKGRPLENALQNHPKGAKEGKRKDEVHTVDATALNIQPIEVEQPPVPNLSYGLERVLFNPGVYHLQDPRSRVYNFDPYLQTIMPVAEFDFNALKQYVTSSKDESLQKIAQKHGKKYVGSTSSMTGVLAHFHFLLSQWRAINTSTLSQGFPDKLRSFTQMQRCPSAIFLRKKGDCYAIDADKEFDSANILSMLGKSMEKFLTLSTEDYERYRKSNSDSVTEHERNSPEAFHYSTMGDFLMRSQLDAYDARLPGTGMFDLKTRAIVSIRMDSQNYEKGKDYEIRSRHGEWESFEREYFDMIRSAFLKYSLQVRMGRMDGIFVAFHNTERIFGFQYISLPEMDSTLHGQWDTSLGDQEFKLGLELLNKCLDRASQKFPGKSLRVHVETRDTQTPFMYVFAEPVTEEQIQKIQTTNQESIADFERRVLGLNDGDSTDDTSPADKASAKKEWAELQAKVAQQMDNDEMSSQENEAVRVVEVGTADGSLGDSGSTSESLEHPDAVTPDAADDGEQQSEQQAVSVAEERYDGVSSESHPSDPVAHQPGSNTKGAAPANLEANGEQYETEPTGGKETEGESYDADRMQEIEGAQKVAEMQENLLRVLNQSLSESERNPSEETEDSKTPGDTRFLDSNDEEQASVIPKGSDSSLLAMTLTIRNKVNGKYVLRPSNLAEDDNWSVEYSLAEVPTASRAWSLYGACQARRKARMDSSNTDNEDDAAANYYLRRMRDLSEKGREWRKVQDSIDQQNEKVVLGQSSPNDPVRRPHLAA